MTRDEVRNMMHDYVDGLLSPEDKSKVDSYLEEYTDVAGEYELLKKLLNKAESLPIGIKTPETLLGKISDELLSKSIERIEEEKQKKLKQLTENTEAIGEKRKKIVKTRDSNRDSDSTSSDDVQDKKVKLVNLWIIVVVLLTIVGAYFLYTSLDTNLPWQVKSNYGGYTIVPVSSLNEIDVDQILNTFDSTKVSVFIPNAGRIDVGSFSSIKVVKGKDSDNIISFISGKIYGNCKIDDPRLTIKTNISEIKVVAGKFISEINDYGELNLITNNGKLKITTPNREFFLVKDHRCKISANGNVGIPIHLKTNHQLAEIFDQISYDDKKVNNYGLILQLSSPVDGITLLHLIMKAKTIEERLPLYDKLNEFYPIVPGITKEGILNLDKDMLDEWQRDIEWQL